MRFAGKPGEQGTVTLFSSDMEDLHACDRGMSDNAALFPLTISTDPGENIETAITVVHNGTGCDVRWLYNMVHRSGYADELHHFERLSRSGMIPVATCDAFIVAQWLAAVADVLLMKHGR